MGRRARAKGPSRQDPLQVWRRAVRRALRDYVAAHDTVPGLVCFVSRGTDPRKVEMLRLELLPDRRAIRGAIVAEVERFESRYAAYGGLMRTPDDGPRWFGLLVCDAREAVSDGAQASVQGGLGGWQEGTFKLGDDFTFVQQALAASAAGTAP